MANDTLLVTNPLFTNLQTALRDRINSMSYSKRTFRFFQTSFGLILVVLAAGNAALVAASQLPGAQPYWGWAAIIVSALVSIVTGANGLVKPKEKHVQNAEALNEVYDIKARLDWRAHQKPDISDEEINAFFLEFRKHEKAFFSSLAKINMQV